MQKSNSWQSLVGAVVAAAFLAGCATTPAPVVNRSFSPGAPASPTAPAAQPATSNAAATQTFGLGHANGTISAAGYTVAPGDTLYSIAFAHGMDVRTLAAQNDIPAPYTLHPGQVLKLQVPQAAGATVAAGTTAIAAAPAAPATPPASPVFGPVTTQSMSANGVAPAESAAAATTAPAFGPVTTQNMTSGGVAPASSSAAMAEAPSATAIAPPVPAAPVAATTPTPPPGATRTVAGITWRWPASGKVVGGFKAGLGGDGAGVDIAGNVGDSVRAAADGTVVYSGNGLIGYGELVIIKHNDTYLSAYGHNSRRLVKEGQHVDAGQEIALMGASGAPRVELHFEIRKDGKPVDPLGYLPDR